MGQRNGGFPHPIPEIVIIDHDLAMECGEDFGEESTKENIMPTTTAESTSRARKTSPKRIHATMTESTALAGRTSPKQVPAMMTESTAPAGKASPKRRRDELLTDDGRAADLEVSRLTSSLESKNTRSPVNTSISKKPTVWPIPSPPGRLPVFSGMSTHHMVPMRDLLSNYVYDPIIIPEFPPLRELSFSADYVSESQENHSTDRLYAESVSDMSPLSISSSPDDRPPNMWKTESASKEDIDGLFGSINLVGGENEEANGPSTSGNLKYNSTSKESQNKENP